jgi:hypothetical protein
MAGGDAPPAIRKQNESFLVLFSKKNSASF